MQVLLRRSRADDNSRYSGSNGKKGAKDKQRGKETLRQGKEKRERWRKEGRDGGRKENEG